MKSHIGMGSQRSVEELIVKAKEVLEELASCTHASGFIWMVIKKEGANLGGCSPNLKPYEAALNDEVEKATERPVVVTLEGDPPRLPRTERVLLALAKTRHVELHPIVAMMIQGLNEINNHKVPRVKALADPSTIPRWFPLSAEAYASRSQKMDLHQLFCVLDSIFNEVRGNVRSIRALHSMLDKAYKSGSCSIGTRAGMDSFFHFLEEEAVSRGGGRPNISSMVPGFEAFLRSFGNGHGFSAFGEYQAKGGMLAPPGGESMDFFGVSPAGGLSNGYPPLPITSYQNGCLLPERYTEGKTPPLVNGLAHVQSDSLLHLLEEPVLAGGVNGNESVSSKEGGAMQAADLEGGGGTEKVSKAVEKFTGEKQGKGFVWIVVTEKEGKLGGCSPGLRPYGPALMDEVERAVLE